ncbi:MAG: uroporphyrinogen decarboxylase [Luteibaculaceae bacterium]
MEKLHNDLLLRAARGETTERTPIWMMRQAGRILPEYRAVRSKFNNFIEFVKNPESAAEVTIQPVDLLGVDAAIIFSDILVIPEAMGYPYQMIKGKGPFFEHTLKSASDIEKLAVADPEESLAYVLDAISLVKKDLNGRVPTIGFAGAPWTILCYLTEGQGSKTFSVAKKLLYQEPVLAHKALQKITDATILYLKAQIARGVNIVQLFDSWAGVLGPDQYRSFSLPYLQQIAAAITEVPVTLFAKDAWFAIEDFANTSCNVIGIDWTVSPQLAISMSKGKTLQGNLDPCALYADFDSIKETTRKMLNQFGQHPHIANLGHGLYPDIDPVKAKYYVQCVKELSVK